MTSDHTTPEPGIVDFIVRSGLSSLGDQLHFEPLPGGVSSDIWLVHGERRRSFCVKRALPRLRVEAEWRADIRRNASEVAWLTRVAAFDRDRVPAVLASDPTLGVFAMEYLPPSQYEIWKRQLARGHVNVETAAAVGCTLARIHSVFARADGARAEFDTDAQFHALRLEPYLLATARVHSDLAPILEELAERTGRTKTTVVHGDASPKNLLIGPRGPVYLDAECAWFGDPAFDLAFCLNHLLLKTVWVPSGASELLRAFDSLADAYLAGVDWEARDSLEERAARLLPGLMLARIDGKSPVEYITDAGSKNTVRTFARRMLLDPVTTLASLRRVWG